MGVGGNPFPLKDKKIPETAEEDDRMMRLARAADTKGKLSDTPRHSPESVRFYQLSLFTLFTNTIIPSSS